MGVPVLFSIVRYILQYFVMLAHLLGSCVLHSLTTTGSGFRSLTVLCVLSCQSSCSQSVISRTSKICSFAIIAMNKPYLLFFLYYIFYFSIDVFAIFICVTLKHSIQFCILSFKLFYLRKCSGPPSASSFVERRNYF